MKDIQPEHRLAEALIKKWGGQTTTLNALVETALEAGATEATQVEAAIAVLAQNRCLAKNKDGNFRVRKQHGGYFPNAWHFAPWISETAGKGQPFYTHTLDECVKLGIEGPK